MSTTTNKRTMSEALGHAQALAAGAQKHFPNEKFRFEKRPFTTVSLVALLLGVADAYAALAKAHAMVKDAKAALRATGASDRPIVRAFERYVHATFGNAAQVLADFDLRPPKERRKLTAEERALAKAKSAATRKARGTTSKKQKLAIRGDVTGVEITTVRAHGASSPHEEPASPPPNGDTK